MRRATRAAILTAVRTILTAIAAAVPMHGFFLLRKKQGKLAGQCGDGHVLLAVGL